MRAVLFHLPTTPHISRTCVLQYNTPERKLNIIMHFSKQTYEQNLKDDYTIETVY
jgi:hypothetical protein